MELLIDLKGPAADVKVAESQFAGIHLDLGPHPNPNPHPNPVSPTLTRSRTRTP